jgi:hypothetical protein
MISHLQTAIRATFSVRARHAAQKKTLSERFMGFARLKPWSRSPGAQYPQPPARGRQPKSQNAEIMQHDQ